MDEPRPALPKPDELLALHEVAEGLFDLLRSWFAVPSHVTLDLTDVDSAVVEMGDPTLIAAMAMRKLQALRLLATPGVLTTTDVVVAIIQDLQRALLQAPAMRLKVRAAATDWDAELEQLERGVPVAEVGDHAPAGADDADPEAERFVALHQLVQVAMFAVLEASEGEIRVFV
ncbi:MAG: hypothetical protein MUF83_10980 [Acidimicrobiales bacterium]|jgi:hypothetical protein|nr:hypothetical protein [Acidimicrobiales bacterium]